MRGDVAAAASGEERDAFAHPEPHPWERRALELSAGDIDSAWWLAMERILADPRYADLHIAWVEGTPDGEETSAPDKLDTFERKRYLRKRLAIAPDAGLIPLGPDPISGLEEFAVAGTGNIRLRHPDPLTDDAGTLPIIAGDAIVLVLIPGAESGALQAAQTESSATESQPKARIFAEKAFLFAKTEATTTQLPIAALDGGTEVDAGRGTSQPQIVGWDAARAALEKHGLRFPTRAEWELAGSAPDSIPTENRIRDALSRRYETRLRLPHEIRVVANRERNAFGLYDMRGNAREWEALEPKADPRALVYVARGGAEDVVVGKGGVRLRLGPDDTAGVRAARDVPTGAFAAGK